METAKQEPLKTEQAAIRRQACEWVKPELVPVKKPYGSGCSTGDNYYVKCDSGGSGDL